MGAVRGRHRSDAYAGMAPSEVRAVELSGCSVHGWSDGTWSSNPSHVRSTYRDVGAADLRASLVGIRLARMPPSESQVL